MKISFSANGNQTLNANRESVYKFSAVVTGNFGGGTLTITGVINGAEITLATISAAGETVVETQCQSIKVALAGATTPALNVELAGINHVTKVEN